MNLAKYALDNTKIVYFFLAVLLIGVYYHSTGWERKRMHPLSSNQRS